MYPCNGPTPSAYRPSAYRPPLSGTPIGLTVFAAASLLKDAVNHFGDLADDGKPNDSFKP
jgi:hypothetical protein